MNTVSSIYYSVFLLLCEFFDPQNFFYSFFTGFILFCFSVSYFLSFFSHLIFYVFDLFFTVLYSFSSFLSFFMKFSFARVKGEGGIRPKITTVSVMTRTVYTKFQKTLLNNLRHESFGLLNRRTYGHSYAVIFQTSWNERVQNTVFICFCKYGNTDTSHVPREQFNKLHDTYAN